MQPIDVLNGVGCVVFDGVGFGVSPPFIECESGLRRVVHLSRHKWPGGLVGGDSQLGFQAAVLSE